MTIGQRIRMRRKELNLTLKDISERENINAGGLSEMENDKYLPSAQTLIGLGRVLNCSIDWLLTGNEYKGQSGRKLDIQKSDIQKARTEQGLMCDGSPLTEMEADLVAMFRLMPDEVHKEVFDYTYFKYKCHVEKNGASIYSTYSDARSNKKSGHTQDKAQDATA